MREKIQPSTNKAESKNDADQIQSRFEKFASTQAAGDGIQGETLKSDKTVDEKIGANMADRK